MCDERNTCNTGMGLIRSYERVGEPYRLSNARARKAFVKVDIRPHIQRFSTPVNRWSGCDIMHN